MDNATYTTLTRQAGLMREMSVVANNIANAATTGFRQEGMVFSEYVRAIEGGPSLSMATAGGRHISDVQGPLQQTGGQFDFAIEGTGFFRVETPEGDRLTRAGSFSPNAAGDLVTAEGFRVLDAGGGAIFVPPNATNLAVGTDGTISSDGQPIAQIGLFLPERPETLTRAGGTAFTADGELVPVFDARILQGFVENSNVDTVSQLARMIEVQRAYEMGQGFLDKEDDRIRNAIKSLTR
ncbi:flagellar hook-basal body complex protein [Shimia biformata]|uniref:flagellar hook-basal body complex protein n=1 Tax=Shimia biformata TaxID=1294299 RepID=UPI001951CFBC|nr:flagellar hook-basal body complex protein [Shimia biformata]